MKVLIVGGVAGGAGTAARLRRNDEAAEIIMFEKGEYISFANCGLPYYIGGVITAKSELQLQTPAGFGRRFNVDVRVHSEVTAIDPQSKTVTVHNSSEQRTYTESYDKLVLSPGASPIRPPFDGMQDANLFTLRSIPDTYAISDFVEANKPATCAIIGAGFIGLEMAENLMEKGIQVTVIEAAEHVMPPIDMDMAHGVHNYIRKKGAVLLLGSKCKSFTKASVILEDGYAVPAQMVILCIGVAPETAFLRDSGIALGRRGEILVNEYLETSLPDVYALGDAIAVKDIVSGNNAVIPLASPANKQARIAADNLVGRRIAYKGSQGTSIMKFFDMTVACTGAKEETLKALGLPYAKSINISPSHAKYYPGGTTMTIKLLFHPETGVVLGAQIVGADGVDKRIDILAAAVRNKLDVYDLQELELAYAPPFSSAKDPVNMAGYVAGNIIEGQMIPFFPEEIDSIPRDAIRLDVRTPQEIARGAIPGFINIPLDSLRERYTELDLGKEIYISCQVGQRGYVAQRILMQHGAKTKNLAGGYTLYSAVMLDKAELAEGLHSYTPCGMPSDRS